MKENPHRKHFDYCWPGDSKILGLSKDNNDFIIEFSSFTVSLDDPWNKSGNDLQLGNCQCRFLSCRKNELRMWQDDKNFTIEKDLSRLVGSVLEDSGDMPSDSGHYFELTGFCNTDWFEFRIFCNEYVLHFSEADENKMN